MDALADALREIGADGGVDTDDASPSDARADGGGTDAAADVGGGDTGTDAAVVDASTDMPDAGMADTSTDAHAADSGVADASTDVEAAADGTSDTGSESESGSTCAQATADATGCSCAVDGTDVVMSMACYCATFGCGCLDPGSIACGYYPVSVTRYGHPCDLVLVTQFGPYDSFVERAYDATTGALVGAFHASDTQLACPFDPSIVSWHIRAGLLPNEGRCHHYDSVTTCSPCDAGCFP